MLAVLAACDRPRDTRQEDELRAEQARSAEMRAGYEERIRALEAELTDATDGRVRREQEWLRYTQALSKLSSAAEKPAASFEPVPETAPGSAAGGAAAPAAPSPEPDPRARAAALRDAEILQTLRALFDLEQVTGYGVLESGSLQGDATGPVVLRALDDRGRPVGTISADRLRLEASRSARTLTLVLERGYERRGAERFPFEGPVDADGRGAEMRIELPEVDPAPWIEALPELFREAEKAEAQDDGKWDLGQVRAGMNVLLREDAAGGWWRIVALGGVQGSVARDVQLDGLDREGRLERKLFADRMQALVQDKGVMLLLEGGAQVRGDEKTPFLEGRYRIFLPRADVERWRKAGVPGLSEPPERRRAPR